MRIKALKLYDEALLPYRATKGSAGADLFAYVEEDVIIEPLKRVLIPTGIAIEIPEGYGGFVFPRSSVASKFGVTLSNCVGVIDSDYRGEVKIAVINLGSESFTVKMGDRIAQLVIMPVEDTEFVFDEKLSNTVRGEGGFGSTGK